jgi:hypothetical protein
VPDANRVGVRPVRGVAGSGALDCLGQFAGGECIPQCIPTARYEEDVQARLGFSKCLIRNGP